MSGNVSGRLCALAIVALGLLVTASAGYQPLSRYHTSPAWPAHADPSVVASLFDSRSIGRIGHIRPLPGRLASLAFWIMVFLWAHLSYFAVS